MMKNNNNNNTKTATIKNNSLNKKTIIPFQHVQNWKTRTKQKREKDDSSVPLLEFGTTYYRIPKQNQSSTGFCQEKERENIHGIIIKPTTTTTKALFVQVV